LVLIRKAGVAWSGLSAPRGTNFELPIEVIDMLHKGKVNTANTWAAKAGQANRQKAIEVMAKVIEYKGRTKLKADETMDRFFKEDEVVSMYAWFAQADVGDQANLCWFVEQLIEGEKDGDLIYGFVRRFCCQCLSERIEDSYTFALQQSEMAADGERPVTESEAWGDYFEQKAIKAGRSAGVMAKVGSYEVEMADFSVEGPASSDGNGSRSGRQDDDDRDLVRKNQMYRQSGRELLQETNRSVDGLGSRARKSKKQRQSLNPARRSALDRAAGEDSGDDDSGGHIAYSWLQPEPEAEAAPSRSSKFGLGRLLGGGSPRDRSDSGAFDGMLEMDSYAGLELDLDTRARDVSREQKAAAKAEKQEARQERKQEKKLAKVEKKQAKVEKKENLRRWEVTNSYSQHSHTGLAAPKKKTKAAKKSDQFHAMPTPTAFEAAAGSMARGSNPIYDDEGAPKKKPKKPKKPKKKKPKKNESPFDAVDDEDDWSFG
jgi:hypothetical protein